MRIFSRIIGNKVSDGLLTDSVGLYDSTVDLVVVLDHHKMFYVVGKSGKKRNTFREEKWGRDVAAQPLQQPFTSLTSSVQTNLTSDTERPNTNTRRQLGKIKDAGTRRRPASPQSQSK